MSTFRDLKAKGSALRDSVLKGSVFRGPVLGDFALRNRVLGNPVVRKLALLILGSGVSLAVMGAAVTVPLGFLAHAGSGDPTEISLDVLEQRSYVYAADGAVLAGLHGEINREPVTLDEVPAHLINAIIAVEDQGFWVHDGVDVRGAMRALAVNVDEGDIAQGGSTLTQQVVKLSLLGNEQSLERKLKEVVLAQRLEKELSKEEILTRYINLAYFGNSAYGVQTAAETYFGVSADELDIGQSALLAGMIRNPSNTDPVRNPEEAGQRRSAALGQMHELGFITPEEQEWFDAAPLPTEIQRVVPPPDHYFVDEVQQQLLHDDRFEVLGDTYEERERAVFQGGLRIQTTFNPTAQQQALAARDEVLPGENGLFTAGTDPETGEERQGSGALISVDPATGAVRTMVGGPGFERGVEDATGQQFNLATRNERQGGSTHKVWVLASLMEQGYSPQDLVNGIGPCSFANPGGEQDPYTVPNYEGKTGEVDTILAQTLRSSNCSYMRLAFIADHENVVDMAERLGIRSALRNEQDGVDISLPLGVKETTPLEMASAYATLANDGVYNEPYYIESIEGPDGRVIYRHEPDPERAISTDAARLVTSVLEQNTISGTGTRAGVPDQPTAGKTGTTNNNSDVWFVGYTPQLATAVWVGGLGSNEPFRIEGASPSSSRHPAQMFGTFMAAYYEGREPVAFPDPPDRPGGTYLQPDPADDLSGGSGRPGEDEEDEDEEEPERPGPRPSWPTFPTPSTGSTSSTETTPPWPTLPTLPTTEPPPTTDDPGGGGGGGRPRPGGETG